MDEVSAVNTGLLDLAPMLDDGEREELMLDLLEDAAAGNVITPAVNDISQPVQRMKKMTADVGEPVLKPPAVKIKTSSLLQRLLKYSLPLSLLFIILFGGLYLLCDQWHDALGLLISPQLKHVRGAPPV